MPVLVKKNNISYIQILTSVFDISKSYAIIQKIIIPIKHQLAHHFFDPPHEPLQQQYFFIE